MDIGTELAVDVVMGGLVVMVGLTAVAITLSDIQQRQLEQMKEAEQQTLPKEVVVWQTMF